GLKRERDSHLPPTLTPEPLQASAKVLVGVGYVPLVSNHVPGPKMLCDVPAPAPVEQLNVPWSERAPKQLPAAVKLPSASTVPDTGRFPQPPVPNSVPVKLPSGST